MALDPTLVAGSCPAPTSLWPSPIKRFLMTISEFPLAVFVLIATSIGVLATLRYFKEIGYPIPDIGALLAAAGLVTAAAVAIAGSLATLICVPLLVLQMRGDLRLRRIDVALALIIPASLFLAYALLAPSWRELGSPWNWFVLVSTVGALLLFAKLFQFWSRIKRTSARDRLKYAWLLMMCGASTVLLADGVNLLIQAAGGASILTNNQRAVTLLFLYLGAVALISALSRFQPRTAFSIVLTTVVVILAAGSIWTAELPKALVTLAGIRINGSVELLVSKETCARVQFLAQSTVQQQEAKWQPIECPEDGVMLRANAQVHSGGRWLLQPIALQGKRVPAGTMRLTAADAAVELVLPSLVPPSVSRN